VIRNIINAYFYGEFEALDLDARGGAFHVPWSEPRTPLPGRYERVNPWLETPDEIIESVVDN
jgi:hypothetical protein